MTSDEFKAIRLRLGCKTPTELAERIGVSHMTIYSYENYGGTIKKPTEMLMKLLSTAPRAKLKEIGFY